MRVNGWKHRYSCPSRRQPLWRAAGRPGPNSDPHSGITPLRQNRDTEVTNMYLHVQDNRRHYEAGKKDGHHATQALQRGHNRLRDLSVPFAGGQLRSNDWLEVNIELLWFSLLVKPY